MSSSVVPILVAKSQREGKQTQAARSRHESSRTSRHRSSWTNRLATTIGWSTSLSGLKTSGMKDAQVRSNFLEQFLTCLMTLRIRGDHRVVGALEQLILELKFLVTVFVNLEPLREIQRTQPHREAPPLRVEGHVGKGEGHSATALAPHDEEVEQQGRQRYRDHDNAAFGQDDAAMDIRTRHEGARPRVQ